MKKTIEEIKQEYGKVVTNAATYNLLQIGLQRYEQTKFHEQIKLVHELFEKTTETEDLFPMTKDFVLQVLNCQHDLIDLKKPIELMTYFSKPTNKEEE